MCENGSVHRCVLNIWHRKRNTVPLFQKTCSLNKQRNEQVNEWMDWWMSDVLVLHSPSRQETLDLPGLCQGTAMGHTLGVWSGTWHGSASVVIWYLCQQRAGVNWRQRGEALLWKDNFDRKETTPVLMWDWHRVLSTAGNHPLTARSSRSSLCDAKCSNWTGTENLSVWKSYRC